MCSSDTGRRYGVRLRHRTNAGVDNIASFRKMYIFSQEGDRVIVMLTAGNLADHPERHQTARRARAPAKSQPQTIMNVESMYDVADLTGQALRDVRNRNAPFLQQSNIDSSASFIIGGQIAASRSACFTFTAKATSSNRHRKRFISRSARANTATG